MPTATEIAIIAASLAVGLMFDARASDASGDAPRCAVTEIGVGDGARDRQYLEECVPNVFANNRGNCTPIRTKAPFHSSGIIRTASQGSVVASTSAACLTLAAA
jgi:hypothetical protein